VIEFVESTIYLSSFAKELLWIILEGCSPDRLFRLPNETVCHLWQSGLLPDYFIATLTINGHRLNGLLYLNLYGDEFAYRTMSVDDFFLW